MILAIDMGNTNIEIGCVDDEKILFTERVSTDRRKTELEYAVLIKTILELHGVEAKRIDGAILASVVPPLTQILCTAVEKVAGMKPMTVGAGLKSGINLKMDNPGSVGADLVVDSVAALKVYGAPCIVIDMGVVVSVDSLASQTSQLPHISLEAPKKVIGKNTVDCMKSGIVFGEAAMLDGMIERFEEELGYPCKVVATGGLSKVIVPHCRKDVILDPMLMMKGLKIIYDKNK